MRITGFYVRPARVPVKKPRKLIRFCATAFVALGSGTAPAWLMLVARELSGRLRCPHSARVGRG